MKLAYYETELLVEVLDDVSSYYDREIENFKDDNEATRIHINNCILKKEIAKRIVKQIKIATVEW